MCESYILYDFHKKNSKSMHGKGYGISWIHPVSYTHLDVYKRQDIDRPRHDGYFEAIIIKPRKGGTIRIYVTLTGRNGNIREDIKGFPYMDIDIYYQIVGRTDYHIDKQRIRLTAEEVQAALVH